MVSATQSKTFPWAAALAGVLLAGAFQPASLFADCNGKPCVLVYRGALTQSTALSPDGTWVKEVELADLDEDGWLDLFLMQKQPLIRWLGGSLQIRPWSNRDLLYLSRGATLGALNFALDAPLPDAYALKDDAFPTRFLTTRGYDAEIVDLDGDQHLDIIRPDTPGSLRVLWGDGTGTFAEVTDVLAAIGGDPNGSCSLSFLPPGLNSGGNYDDVAVGDCSGDHIPDFAVAQYDTCGENLIITNDGQRGFSFTSLPALAARSTHSVSFGNANPGLDNNLDLLLDHGSGSDPQIYFGMSNSRCLFSTTSRFTFAQLFDREPTTVGDLVDLTGDGLLDAFFAKGFEGGDYGIYVNSGNPSAPFSNIVRLPGCPGGPGCPDADKYDVRYGDLDADGYMEAVVANINVSENCRVDANGNCQDDNLV